MILHRKIYFKTIAVIVNCCNGIIQTIAVLKILLIILQTYLATKLALSSQAHVSPLKTATETIV